ncbi:LCP family protein [Candidatus Saccharibacteria bacterium]|jgi:LCP family protein required for cell wall assembly|nr:LCP family protein [Candidatus Saccharibacteria bacterium]MBP9131816.1 LCP family protein [Candidatus Saccharibacteria bacterium]
MKSNKQPKQFDINKFNYTYSNGLGQSSKASQEDEPEVEQEEKPHKKRKWPKRLFVVSLILIIAVGIAVAAAYFYIDKTKLRGEDRGRVNIVLSGVDEAAKLSDTLMIISIDTNHENEADYKAALISIPRDLYVKIPPFGYNKINAAYSLGEANKTSGGGLGLVRSTVEDTFAIDVDYQVALDFAAFKDMVDAVGGVTIDVPVALRDPYYPTEDGGRQLVEFSKGEQEMDGETALKYARSRQTTTDFDRAARQQQVVLAVKQKVLKPEFALDKSKVAKLFELFDKNVKTDLTKREIIRLGDIARQLNDNNVTRHVLDNESDNLLISGNRAGYTLSPRTGNFTEIQEFIADIFSKSKNTLPASHDPAKNIY